MKKQLSEIRQKIHNVLYSPNNEYSKVRKESCFLWVIHIIS